ncbi:hypothetical protein Tco_0745443 [Tanacetum coccineum]
MLTPNSSNKTTVLIPRHRTRDSGPDLSFDIPPSLECKSGLARASSAELVLPLLDFYFSLSLSLLATWPVPSHAFSCDVVGPSGVLTQVDLDELIVKYNIPRDLHPQFPSKGFIMSELSDEAIGFFKPSANKGTGFLAKHRARSPVCIDDNRHRSFAIDDPKPLVGSYSQEDVRRLSAHVKLRDIIEGVLVLSGLSRVWKSRTRDPVLRGFDGNVIGIHDFLCLPEWTGTEVQEEPHHDMRPTMQRLPDVLSCRVNYLIIKS